MHTVLTIAGLDPSGGAGVLADIKTIAAFGCFGAAAITSLTSQNTLGVYAAYHQSPEILRQQIVPVLKDYEVAAVKIGMLPTKELIDLVAAIIEEFSLKNIVLDPVLRSSSGFLLLEDDANQALCERLLPITDLVTPNLAEVEMLLGVRPNSADEMSVAAQQLSQQLSTSVLVKGGHLADEATDVLFDGQQTHFYSAQRIVSRHTHGTGCTLSSAIAAQLARGMKLPEAISQAKIYVTEAIKNAPGIGHGAGPMNHFYRYAPN
ncbi:MAG: bifunctional hydroxymethylpyrimidine kinase/phosphomethylpyrimidine kinase [Acidobacteria bacterium]|nr:bifunctional hydroxymethylpyrimidine kinase/phosphomethylpyrimidine kinase [Acidobacteriota bacterium]